MAASRNDACSPGHSAQGDISTADSLNSRALLPALLLAAVGFATLVLATLLTGGAAGQYLVIGSPWQGRVQMMDMVWQAQGGVVGFGALPFVAVAMTDRPDFAANLRDRGAWMVLPSPVLLGCATGANGGGQ